MRVTDLMSQPVYTCHIDQTVQSAAQMMWEHDCGIVPIVDHDGHLAGVVTDRDICMAALFQNRPLSDIAVTDVMARDVCACRPGDEVTDAELLMSARQVRRLPVISDDGTPMGMLSLGDIGRRVKHSPASHTSAGELVDTLAAICEPHPVPVAAD
jgi:CBS domain-containing protein